MGVTVIGKPHTKPPEIMEPETKSFDWIKAAACGSLICGGLLLLAGKKRAGLIAAVSGTAIAALDHEKTIRNLWSSLPHYVDQAHSMLDHVQEVVDKVAEKGQSLRRTFGQ